MNDYIGPLTTPPTLNYLQAGELLIKGVVNEGKYNAASVIIPIKATHCLRYSSTSKMAGPISANSVPLTKLEIGGFEPTKCAVVLLSQSRLSFASVGKGLLKLQLAIKCLFVCSLIHQFMEKQASK